MSPANCRSSTVNLSPKVDFNFAQSQPVYVYTDIIKPNLDGESYVRLRTSLQFASDTSYHRCDYTFTSQWKSLYRVNFDIPCNVILHFKRSLPRNKSQFVSYNGSIYMVLRKSKWKLGDWSCLLR